MKIMELQIEKFRGIKTEPLTFDSHFSVITGAHRAGKSSTLDALAIVLSGVRSPSAHSSQFFSAPKLQADRRALLASALLNLGEQDVSYSVTRGVVKREKSNSDIAKKKNSINTTSVLYYSTDRAMDLSQAEKKLSNVYSSDFSGLKAKRITTNQLSKATKEAVRRFSPLFGSHDLIEKSSKLSSHKNDHHDSSDLSSGERSLLAMVTDIARQLTRTSPKLNDPLTDGKGVVLIDELELHLHPTLQRNVVEYLVTTFPEVQFITTTNSPFIIQSLKEGQLINLQPDENNPLYADRSIEDFAENIIGIPMPQKSERYQKMMRAAENYYRLLREAEKWYSPVRWRGNSALEKRKQELKRELDELLVPFSDNPAYMALLAFEREIRIGGGENATDK